MKNGESGFHACLNRNKSGITLDLKSEEGKEVFRRLLKTADVVCENYKVGARKSWAFPMRP
ncbi:MAG: CoA transferase [Oscillospiraceae bacterium]